MTETPPTYAVGSEFQAERVGGEDGDLEGRIVHSGAETGFGPFPGEESLKRRVVAGIDGSVHCRERRSAAPKG
ncbi:hypothetical protein EON77_12915 [bacterium]|nr:MAG: hypothetical protein EON77_12915 [bacterium]